MGNCIKCNVMNKTMKTNDEIDKTVHYPVDTLDYLKETEYKDCQVFVPPVSKGKVVKVYDGDTITIASKVDNLINSPIYRFSVRLNGIDTPEIKGKNEDEKEIAKKARDAVKELIYDKIVTLKNVETEKYGRLLADVYIDNIHLNEWLISNRFAVKYGGGTKVSPESWKEYYETGKLE